MKDIHFCITLDVGMTKEQVQECAKCLENTFHKYLICRVENGEHIYSTAGRTMFRHVTEQMLQSDDYNWHEVWSEMK